MENQSTNCPLPTAAVSTPKKKSSGKKPVDVSLASMVAEDSACSLASSILNIATAVDKQQELAAAAETTTATAAASEPAPVEPKKKSTAKNKRDIAEGPTTVTVTVKSKPKKQKKEKPEKVVEKSEKPSSTEESATGGDKTEGPTVASVKSSASPAKKSAEQSTEIVEPIDAELQRKQQEETVQLATAKKRKSTTNTTTNTTANEEGGGKKSRKSGNESSSSGGGSGGGKNGSGNAGNANQITVLVRHHGKIEFAKPIVMEWSPIAAPGVKSVEKYQYLRLPASENIEIKPLMCKIIDLNYGLQFGDKTSHQTNIWTLHNWEPLMCEGVTISSAEPNLQNIRLLLHNCSDNPVLVKQGDPLAIVRFYPMPKKINLKFSSLNE